VALQGAESLLKPRTGFQKHSVLRTEKDYGAVLMASANGRNVEETTEYHVFVLGLDGWRFSLSGGRVAAIAHSEPSIICVGSFTYDRLAVFEHRYGKAFSVMCSRTENQRNASNSHGGHQKTPSCIAALAEWVIKHFSLDDKKFEQVCNPQHLILSPRGGFTDVGRHTGGEPRDTGEALALSLLHFALFSADPALDMPGLLFERALGEYRLQQASAALTALETLAATRNPLLPEAVDAVVLPLADATRRIARIAETCLDDVTGLLDGCEGLRVRLDAAIAENGRRVAESYSLKVPVASSMAALRSPIIFPSMIAQTPPSGNLEIVMK
jgi:hypothetical protein